MYRGGYGQPYGQPYGRPMGGRTVGVDVNGDGIADYRVKQGYGAGPAMGMGGRSYGVDVNMESLIIESSLELELMSMEMELLITEQAQMLDQVQEWPMEPATDHMDIKLRY